MDCCLKQLHRFCHRKVHALAVFGHMKYRDFLLGIPCLTALLILLPDLAADVFVSLISQKYGKTNTKEYLAKKKDMSYNEDEVQKSQIPSGLCG